MDTIAAAARLWWAFLATGQADTTRRFTWGTFVNAIVNLGTLLVAAQIAGFAIGKRSTIGKPAAMYAVAGATTLMVNAIIVNGANHFVSQLIADQIERGERALPILRMIQNGTNAITGVPVVLGLVLLGLAIFVPRPEKSTSS